MSASRKPRSSKVQRHDFTDKNRGVRLQKVLADSGVAARRECETLVLEGAVTVNGHVVDTLPAWVNPETDRVEVYGRPLRRAEKHVYIALFKPRGTVCTNSDPEGRPRAIDLVNHPSQARLYCVGRLDIDASGLLVLTNDGEFANRLTHPRFGVAKGYDMTLDGSLDANAIARIEREILAASRPRTDMRSSLTLINRDREKTVVHLELCEHRNLQIKPLMLELGFPVKKIRRTSFGPLKLKGLAVGEWRDLTAKEVEQLRKASRHENAGAALQPKQPKRSMEEFAEAREARAARVAAEAETTMPAASSGGIVKPVAKAANSAAPKPAARPAKPQGARIPQREGKPQGGTKFSPRGESRQSGGRANAQSATKDFAKRGFSKAGSQKSPHAKPRSADRGGARNAPSTGRGGTRGGFGKGRTR